jgi:non-specific serine/threonine protein kinase
MGKGELDAVALRALRRLLAAGEADDEGRVPLAELARAAQAVPQAARITIDFAAREELGRAMVVLSHSPPVPTSPAWAAKMTKREHEVGRLIAEGLSNKEIAVRLGVTLATVKDHVHHILEKSGLTSRAAVAVRLTGSTGGEV